MKTEFTREYIYSNKGCYSKEQVDNLPFINNEKITIEDLHNNLPTRDFAWFMLKNGGFTKREMKMIAIKCAEHVLPVYDKKHSSDDRVRNCIETTKRYLKGEVNEDVILKARNAAYATYAANAAADASPATFPQFFWNLIQEYR